MNQETATELTKLNRYEAICYKALNNLHEIPAYEKAEIKTLLKRMFVAETEYLQDSPEMYFALYNLK